MLKLPLIITSLHSISDLRMEMGRAYSLDSETPGQSFKSTCVCVCVCALEQKGHNNLGPVCCTAGKINGDNDENHLLMKITLTIL